MNDKRITLIIVAHPDDEVLGCGGMIAQKALIEECLPKVFFLSSGVGARGHFCSAEYKSNAVHKKYKQTLSALNVLGLKRENMIWGPLYEDNKFDDVPLLRIVKDVEKIIQQEEPEVIYTHSRHDLNIDHRLTYQAVLTATRPYASKVKEIYSFEVPSSTECNFPTKFSPNVFCSLNRIDVIKKEKALGQYEDEICQSPHPRSIDGIWNNAEYWGMRMGTEYAEAFELVRMLK